MSEENQNCKVCGKPVIDTNGNVVHVDGGVYEQRCQNCGYVGGQVDKFNKCPSCNDATSLIDDHRAS